MPTNQQIIYVDRRKFKKNTLNKRYVSPWNTNAAETTHGHLVIAGGRHGVAF